MINEKQYEKIYIKYCKPSPKIKDFCLSFLVGGLICVLGQVLFECFNYLKLPEDIINSLVPVTLVILAGFLTGLGIFDKIAKRAGAGTLVPITGFANAVVSPAIEFKNEGFILGVGANIFKIAGPVIAYGTVSSVIYGIIYYLIKMFR